MKRLVSVSIALYGILVAAACGSNTDSVEAKSDVSRDTVVFRKGLDLVPDVRYTDSAQMLFYKDPDGDPKRYTRFYTHLSLTDSGFIKPLLSSLDQSFQEYSQVKNCRSQGKIYLFKKGGEDPLQTVYFSTRCDSCCYVYYIRNGLFYYMNMTDELSEKLKGIRGKAKE